MFIQIMNRAMNEAIFHPLGSESPRMPAPRGAERRTAGVRNARHRRADTALAKSAPATFEIFASAFNTAVHGR